MSHHPHVYLTVYPCTEHLNPPPFLTLQPLPSLLFVYTALLIGELLYFFVFGLLEYAAATLYFTRIKKHSEMMS